mmetsp:Transcript_62652/g.101476  ORF Transcript_62652/g.101476 Transcript_62652/m.101476 type:complete len:83 (+) Transcript_62652:144-392(+)
MGYVATPFGACEGLDFGAFDDSEKVCTARGRPDCPDNENVGTPSGGVPRLSGGRRELRPPSPAAQSKLKAVGPLLLEVSVAH